MRRILNARLGLIENSEVSFEKGGADTAARRRVCGLEGAGADFLVLGWDVSGGDLNGRGGDVVGLEESLTRKRRCVAQSPCIHQFPWDDRIAVSNL